MGVRGFTGPGDGRSVETGLVWGEGGSALDEVSFERQSVLDVAPGPEESPEEELSSSTSMSELGQCPPGSLSAPSSSELVGDDDDN